MLFLQYLFLSRRLISLFFNIFYNYWFNEYYTIGTVCERDGHSDNRHQINDLEPIGERNIDELMRHQMNVVRCFSFIMFFKYLVNSIYKSNDFNIFYFKVDESNLYQSNVSFSRSDNSTGNDYTEGFYNIRNLSQPRSSPDQCVNTKVLSLYEDEDRKVKSI